MTRTPRRLGTSFVRKPLYSREGANVALVSAGMTLVEQEGPYGAEGFIRQALAPLPDFSGQYPVLGSWLVDHTPADCRSARMKIRSPAILAVPAARDFVSFAVTSSFLQSASKAGLDPGKGIGKSLPLRRRQFAQHVGFDAARHKFQILKYPLALRREGQDDTAPILFIRTPHDETVGNKLVDDAGYLVPADGRVVGDFGRRRKVVKRPITVRINHPCVDNLCFLICFSEK